MANDTKTNDSFEDIEVDALRRAQEAGDPEIRLKWIEVAKAIQDRNKIILDAADSSLRCKNAELDLKNQRWRFVATTLTPVLALLITAAALVFQTMQFRKTISFQANQFAQTSALEAVKNEDAKWQELMKSVSFKDPKSALVGALSMQAFFESDRYGKQSRSIAVALLPEINNVNAFDEIFAQIIHHSREDNENDLVSISVMLSMSARQIHGTQATAMPDREPIPPFLQFDVAAIDPNPEYKNEGKSMEDKVIAWELETVSHGLSNLWEDDHLPMDKALRSVTLEHASFQGLDFANADLARSILYQANFKNAIFHGADLSNASLRNVCLDGADLSGIKDFAGSTWKDSNWKAASKISPELQKYLETNYKQVASSGNCGIETE